MSAQLLQESAEYLLVQVSEYFQRRGGVEATPEEICETLESQTVVDTIISQICGGREPDDAIGDHHNYQPLLVSDVAGYNGGHNVD